MSSVQLERPGTLALWWQGARPRTLAISAVPVAVGAAAAPHLSAWRTAAAAVTALGLQVGVNYANDYFDGVRGVDTAARVGPTRLVASGLASPRAVATAAALAVGVAAVAGIALAVAVGPVLLLVGAAAILATFLYSGGPRPYAAAGLGEVAVFAFFGPVATVGTALVETGHGIPAAAWWASIPCGLLAVDVLLVNNIRDIPTDSATGKRTLAVRIGDPASRRLYAAVLAAAYASVLAGVVVRALPVPALLALLALPLARTPLTVVARGRGRELVAGLIATVRLHIVTGVLLTAGLALR
ncbi:MAG TPA: 1,4-dihydroxy-2-naphthoate polyprenyltransferase [Candidatus Dormibacteraeota bacterium]|nr:1,4-dihydroxy-2-naphthoate polyprenyltransferase [Candidatus Dormibacteraeota bacterium]